MSLISDLINLKLPKGPWKFGLAATDACQVGKPGKDWFLQFGTTVVIHPKTKKPLEVPMGILFKDLDGINIESQMTDHFFQAIQALPNVIETILKLKDIVISFSTVVEKIKDLPNIDEATKQEIDLLIEVVRPMYLDAEAQPPRIVSLL